MDTLALLCNLHADGPETLQRLRSAGWDTLREIEEVELGLLEEALDAGHERARRFQREATFLRERLGGEPGANVPPESPPRTARRQKERVVELSGRGVPEEPDVRQPFAAARLSAVEAVPSVEGTARPQTECGTTTDAELELPAREVLIPRPAPPEAEVREVSPPEPPRRTGLRPGSLDGLDADTAERLAEAGIATLAALGSAPTLELSGTTGLDYTSLLRLQFLARRALAEDAPPRAAVRSDDVAGPFA